MRKHPRTSHPTATRKVAWLPAVACNTTYKICVYQSYLVWIMDHTCACRPGAAHMLRVIAVTDLHRPCTTTAPQHGRHVSDTAPHLPRSYDSMHYVMYAHRAWVALRSPTTHMLATTQGGRYGARSATVHAHNTRGHALGAIYRPECLINRLCGVVF